LVKGHPTAPRRLPAAQRRLLLEDAASVVFAERGYAATSLDEIAALAGVTKPIVYRHFGSKKELHLALLARHRDELLAELVRGMSGEQELPGRIRAAAESWFGYVEANPYAMRMLFRDTTGDPEIQVFHRDMQATARSAIRGLMEAEPGFDLSEELRDAVAELVRSAIVGVALWWADNRQVPRDDVVLMASDVIWGGIGRVFSPP
jgi:AcrR family transcriptional regulator